MISAPDTCYTRQLLQQTTFTPGTLSPEIFYTRHLSTPDTCYTRQLLQQTTFTPRTLYTRNLLHQTPFYTRRVTPDNFYNKQLLHQAPFTPETFYTRHLSTPDTCYTRQLLQQTTFTPGTLYTRNLLHQTSFTHSYYQRCFTPHTHTHDSNTLLPRFSTIARQSPPRDVHFTTVLKQ